MTDLRRATPVKRPPGRWLGSPAARVGAVNACVLSLAALCTAHVPAVAAIGYAPWDAEVLLTLAALATAALVAALGLRRWTPVFYFFVCFWVYWALDAYAPDTLTNVWAPWAMALTGLDLTRPQWHIAQAGTIAGVLWILMLGPWSDNVRAMLVAFSAAWFVGVWMSDDRLVLARHTAEPFAARATTDTPIHPPVTAAEAGGFRAPDGRLRPLVHIILDEQMSPRALPEFLPASHLDTQGSTRPHPSRAIVDDYVARGFAFHSAVDSTASQTHRSLSAMLALGPGNDKLRKGDGAPFRHELTDNAYAGLLLRLGYRLHVAQNSWLRLCPESGRTACHTHVYGKTGPMTSRIDAAPSSRLAILFSELHRSYAKGGSYPVAAYQIAQGPLARIGPEHAFENVYFSIPIGALNVLEEASRQIVSIEPGDAHVVHVLLPHFPYMMDPECRVKPLARWSAPVRHQKAGTPPVPLADIYADYWDQAACAHRRVMALVDDVRRRSTLDPIIWVHGDHGARIQASFEELFGDGSGDDTRRTFFAAYTGVDSTNTGSAEGTEVREPSELPALLARVVADLLSTAHDEGKRTKAPPASP